ncbi:DUF4232 domain-containing protein [Streptomyces sp. NPDC047108]|uniref:DUF4232 domain-containing protein n=1 Tax=Streptomyces sp. NPDC047108 TaxID=3155025 RepID=UPI0033E832D9
MRSRLPLCAAGTVLAACSLVLTGCTTDEGTAASVSSRQAEQDGGSKENGYAGGNSGSNHGADAPPCTDENSTVTVVASNGTGKADVKLVNDGDTPCSVVGAPTVELQSVKRKTLNTKAAESRDQETHVIQVDGSGVAVAELTYEGGTVSEGGSRNGISCGSEAVRALVSWKDQRWEAEIRTNESGGSENSVPGAMIVCDPASTVGPFHD